MPLGTRPLEGLLVVDLSRYLPGPFASRELQRLGARVVRLESPDGDPLRRVAPAWDEAINTGKESVVCDLKAESELGRALCGRADVVIESFRPGVATRLGIGPDDVPERVVYCSLTGFGSDGARAQQAGHDLNYVGYAGALADTAPTLPPVQIADLAAGSLTAVSRIVAALYERERAGRGARLELSLTHGAHELVAHRLGGEPIDRLLTGGLACYRVYPTADGRHLTVAALEEKFFRRLCALLDREDLVARQYEAEGQDELAAELEGIFAMRSLADWLELFEVEDVSVGPVSTLAEAAEEFGASGPELRAPRLGEHTEAWRQELGL